MYLNDPEKVANEIFDQEGGEKAACVKTTATGFQVFKKRDPEDENSNRFYRENWIIEEGKAIYENRIGITTVLKDCISKEEFVKQYTNPIKPKTGMEGFIEQATGEDGVNQNNLWDSIKPIVPGLIIASLFAIAIIVVERIVNKSSKGKA